MGRSLSKAMLVSELAAATDLDGKDVARILDSLATIAFREAHNGFIIPRICKLKVIRKKPTQCRNPATGRLMRIGERNALKILPLKPARDAIAPRRDDLVSIIDEPAATPDTPPAVTPPAPPTLPEQAIPPEPETQGQILFECAECKSTLSAAPGEAGMKGECPYCNNPIQVPQQRKPVDHEIAEQRMKPVHGPIASETAQEFITLNCQTCGQEIEAPCEMLGMEVNCPACSAPLLIAKTGTTAGAPAGTGETADGQNVDLSSMTIRIDLSDLE